MFQKLIGQTSADAGEYIIQNGDGTYVLCGTTKDTLSQSERLYVAKLNANGETLWENIFTHTNETGKCVIKANDGGYILFGETHTTGFGESDILLIKISENGNLEWSKQLGGDDFEIVEEAVSNGSDAYYVTGRTSSYGAGTTDIFLLKIDNSGAQIWAKTYGGSEQEEAYNITWTNNGDLLISGRTVSYSLGNSDAYLLRLNADGDTVWTRTLGGDNVTWAYDGRETTSGDIFLAGYLTSQGQGLTETYLTKLTSSGSVLWEKIYGSSHHNFSQTMTLTNDGGLIMSGGENLYTLRVDANGDTLWTSHFGPDVTIFPALPFRIITSLDQGFTIVGKTKHLGFGGADIFLVKMNENGVSGCNQLKASTAIQNVSLIQGSGGIINSFSFQQDSIELSVDTLGLFHQYECLGWTGVSEMDSDLIGIYPNPTTGAFHVSFAGFKGLLTIFNTTGEKVIERLLVRDETTIDVSLLNAGLYFVRLQNDMQSATKAIQIVKR